MTFRKTNLVGALLIIILVTIRPAAAQISQEQFQLLMQRLSALEKRMDQIENEITASTSAPLVSPAITGDVAAQIESLDQAIRIADRKRELDQEASTAREAAAPVAAAGPSGFSLQSANGDYRLI